MKEAYDSIIEVWIDKPEEVEKKKEKLRQTAREACMRRNHYGEGTSRFEMADLFRRLTDDGISLGKTGYLGSHHNVDFETLYRVFGGDPLAYLFDGQWVPRAVFDAFDTRKMLNRLATFASAAERLRDGDKLPIPLEQVPVRGGSSEHDFFSEGRDRWFLTHTLKEIRDFGNLGLALEQAGHKLRVGAHIWNGGYGRYDNAIMSCARRLHPLTDEVTEHAVGQAIEVAIQAHLEGQSREARGPLSPEVKSIRLRPKLLEGLVGRLSASGDALEHVRADLYRTDKKHRLMSWSRVFPVHLLVDRNQKLVNAVVIEPSSKQPGRRERRRS